MNGNWTDLILLSIPLLFLVSAATAPALQPRAGWRVLQGSNALALLLVLTLPLLADPLSGWFLNDPLHLIVQGLVTFIGLVVARFSSHYLDGEAGQQRFQRWLQLTLACVMLVVTTNHLLLLVAGWAGISLSLHQLLMFYPERKRAALAAHKKFLFARLAELCLAGAGLLLFLEHGSLFLSDLLGAVGGPDGLSRGEQVAALLIASAAMVKCAQFPMHGWLIQVVEAPTPVSALLHAGVINLGGFLLLLMAPLMRQAELANWLLLVVAGLTCVAAALVTMTRVSIKVLLAWSTVAQMGLMLVECALGQYGLALLHLVAHSCYKAYAFLNAGSEVENYLRRQLAPVRLPSSGTLPLLFLAALLPVAALTYLGMASTEAGLWLLLALLPVILLSERASTLHGGSLARAGAATLGVIVLYVAFKSLFVAIAPASAAPSLAQEVWFGLLVVTLLGAYWLLRYRGHSGPARRLYRNLYAGFYLDEWATRTTLALWPARLPLRVIARRSSTTPSTTQENLS